MENTLKLPQHLLDFWVHRLTNCGFKQIKGKFIDKADTNCRCAAGTLMPVKETFDPESEEDLGSYLAIRNISNTQLLNFRSVSDSSPYAIFTLKDATIITLNDFLSKSFTDIAQLLINAQNTGNFNCSPLTVHYLQKMYELAIANREYSISGLEAQ